VIRLIGRRLAPRLRRGWQCWPPMSNTRRKRRHCPCRRIPCTQRVLATLGLVVRFTSELVCVSCGSWRPPCPVNRSQPCFQVTGQAREPGLLHSTARHRRETLFVMRSSLFASGCAPELKSSHFAAAIFLARRTAPRPGNRPSGTGETINDRGQLPGLRAGVESLPEPLARFGRSVGQCQVLQHLGVQCVRRIFGVDRSVRDAGIL